MCSLLFSEVRILNWRGYVPTQSVGILLAKHILNACVVLFDWIFSFERKMILVKSTRRLKSSFLGIIEYKNSSNRAAVFYRE